MIKVLVTTDGSDWHGMTAERIWVSVLEPTLGLVRNNPLYAYGISYGDVIRCRSRDDGSLIFEQVVRQGGHSNYRLLLKSGKTAADFLKTWPPLEELGCSYESSAHPEDVFAISVPPSADVDRAYQLLMRGEEQGTWHLDEGNYEHGAR